MHFHVLKTALFTISIFLSHSLWSAPIHKAAAKGDINKIKKLMKSGVDVNVPDKEENTPLSYAVKNNKKKMVEFLLKNGADLNSSFGFSSMGTPLNIAMEENHQDLVEFLIKKGARLKFHVSGYHIPLIWAIEKKYSAKLLKLIINHKDVDVNESEYNQGTALHMAMVYGVSKGVFQLLIKKGADVNAKNEYGQTPLLVAVDFKEGTNFIESLIKEGADVKAKDNGGRTVLHELVVKSKKSALIMDYLIKVGAEVNAKDIGGHTPLDYAHWLKRGEKTINALKKHGAVATELPPKKNTCLFYDEKSDMSFRLKKVSNSSSKSSFSESSTTKPKTKEKIILELKCKKSPGSYCKDRFMNEYIEVDRLLTYHDGAGNTDYYFLAVTAHGLERVASIYYDHEGDLGAYVTRDFRTWASDRQGLKRRDNRQDRWFFEIPYKGSINGEKFEMCVEYLYEFL